MPGATVSEPPSVSLSFANNFWGKDDAGVSPLLERMHNAKVTGDELKAFYSARAAIEDEYARKLLNLSRKPLGSSEAGTLRMSLDVVRGEVESMGKAHQGIAAQMKSELEEPLAAFAGGIKERRKIVQTGIEKLLKVKTQQTITVNKARDRYEQDCLKIKGYLAQGHMVMGQEERKNKAKLEKTQIQLSSTSNEYEAAVKVLEETTGRWNRDWKAACDRFQDLEEERIDFMKSSLWTFANIASTVCVSDDASCEKIRLSLEDCDVQKDITGFIRESGTGQEIPDPPKFIDFCRGDTADNVSEASDDGNYSVAQFQRTMNPAFRSSSPQPSMFESHHDPKSPLAKELGHNEPRAPSAEATPTQMRKVSADPRRPSQSQPPQFQQGQLGQLADIPKVPHNEYPMDGMTQFCRLGPPSERSSVASPVRPSSRDSQSEYSNPTSFSSVEPSSGAHSPVKQTNGPSDDERAMHKKRSGFFQNHSPFRRKSKHEKEPPQNPSVMPSTRSTWAPSSIRPNASANPSPTRQPGLFSHNNRSTMFSSDRPTASPEPVDPRASFQLNVGNNVFDVASPEAQRATPTKKAAASEELDPIAQALAELKGVTKQSSVRMSADRYHGLATPAPPGTPGNGSGGMPTPLTNGALGAAQRGTPPPSYDPGSRLGAPQPAFTSRAMQQTTQKYIDQKTSMFNSPARPSAYDQRTGSHSSSRPGTRNGPPSGQDGIRSTSPAPPRSLSPRPGLYDSMPTRTQTQPPPQQPYRSTSPNPYAGGAPAMGGVSSNARPRAQSSSPVKPRDSYGPYGSPSTMHGNSPGQMPRAVSPQPQQPRFGGAPDATRPGSSRGSDMALQLAQPGQAERPVSSYGGSQRGGRPVSSYYGNGAAPGAGGPGLAVRPRAKSIAAPGEFTSDGRRILHYARAMYMYQAAIPEELGFAKGDTLAILRVQDDGWWEAEIVGKKGKRGLVPSNYLQTV